MLVIDQDLGFWEVGSRLPLAAFLSFENAVFLMCYGTGFLVAVFGEKNHFLI